MAEKTNWKDVAKYWHKYAMILRKALLGDFDFIEFLVNSDEELMDIIDELRKSEDELREEIKTLKNRKKK